MLLLYGLDLDRLLVFCFVAVPCLGGLTAPEFFVADFACVLTIGETLLLVAFVSFGSFLRRLAFFFDLLLAGFSEVYVCYIGSTTSLLLF